MPTETLTIMSCNIDKTLPSINKRIEGLVKIVSDVNPDVIVVQEGTKMIYSSLLREMGIVGYKGYLPPNVNERDSGEMIFSKHKMSNVGYLSYGTFDQKGLTCANVKLPGSGNICVMTTQISEESKYQSTQFSMIPTLVRSRAVNLTPVVLAGDFKMKSYDEKKFKTQLVDAWIEAGSNKQKWTLSNKNPYNSVPSEHRPDRIYYTDIDGWNCVDFQLKSVEDPISSHYITVATFEYDIDVAEDLDIK